MLKSRVPYFAKALWARITAADMARARGQQSHQHLPVHYDTTGMGKRCIVVQQSSLFVIVGPEKRVAIHCDDGESDTRALASLSNV